MKTYLFSAFVFFMLFISKSQAQTNYSYNPYFSNEVISTGNDIRDKERVVVYPNPSSNGQVSIQFTGTDINTDMMLVDISGRNIKQWKAVSNNRVDIGNLKKGVYTLVIRDRQYNTQTTKKIIVLQ